MYQTVACIMGVSQSSINRVLQRWIPQLGRIGRLLSILDLDCTHNYISKDHAEKYNLPHYSTQTTSNKYSTYMNFVDASIPTVFKEHEMELLVL